MGKNNVLVSIITPSFNQERYIEETLLSVKNQTYNNIEHIVIDGGSTDHTLDILKKYEGSIIWSSEPDKGQTNAINKGIRKSKGEILAYLNSDDLYLPDSIEIITTFFKEHPDIDMVYGNVIHIDSQSQVIENVQIGEIVLEDYLTCQVYLPQPTVFFRRKIIEKIGYFDETINLPMDLDYWIRIFLNAQTAYVPVYLAKARFHSETKSSRGYLNNVADLLLVLDKTFQKEDPLINHFKTQDRISQVKKRSYSYVYFFGGLRFLRYRQINNARKYLNKGLKLNPWLFFNPYLLWSIFIAIVGVKISDKIIPYLPRISKI